MSIRLTQCRQEMLTSDRELTDLLAFADIITAKNAHNGRELCLWKRPPTEIVARGLPTRVEVLAIEFSSQPELRRYRELVNRLKNGN